MKILLDTHILVRLHVDKSLLSLAQLRAIEEASAVGGIHLSAISFWEILQLEKRGRLRLDIDTTEWLLSLERASDLNVIPISATIAMASHNLPDNFPKDPADRFLAATAKSFGLNFLTNDEQIIKSQCVQTVA